MIFCIAGTFPEMPHSEITNLLESQYGSTQENVTKNTSYLISNLSKIRDINSSDNIAMALKFGIPIVNIDFITDSLFQKKLQNFEDAKYDLSNDIKSAKDSVKKPTKVSKIKPKKEKITKKRSNIEIIDIEKEIQSEQKKTPKSKIISKSIFDFDSHDKIDFDEIIKKRGGEFSDETDDDEEFIPGRNDSEQKNKKSAKKRSKTRKKRFSNSKLLFEGLIFRIVNLGKSEFQVRKFIRENGGEDFGSDYDYVVFTREQIEQGTNLRLKVAQQAGIPVVSEDFIFDSVKKGKLLTDTIDQYTPRKYIDSEKNIKHVQNKPFDGFVFAIDGRLSLPKHHIISMIDENGGTVSRRMAKRITHLLTSAENVESETPKVKFAIENRIEIVSLDFLTRCASRHELLDSSRWLLYDYDNSTYECSDNGSFDSVDETVPSKRTRLVNHKSDGKYS